jgi:hypothetical protein
MPGERFLVREPDVAGVVTAGVGDDAISLPPTKPLSFALVRGPTKPLTGEMPSALWKRVTACSVRRPKYPVGVAARYPAPWRYVWRRVTSDPVLPTVRFLVKAGVLVEEGDAGDVGIMILCPPASDGFAATTLLRSTWVWGLTDPVFVRSWAFWKRRTACSVVASNDPVVVAATGKKPRFLRTVWRRVTSLPVSPTWRVRGKAEAEGEDGEEGVTITGVGEEEPPPEELPPPPPEDPPPEDPVAAAFATVTVMLGDVPMVPAAS